MYRAICQAWIPFLTYKKTRQNVAVTYMESFLSRVTGKTFPWSSWCHVTYECLHLMNF